LAQVLLSTGPVLGCAKGYFFFSSSGMTRIDSPHEVTLEGGQQGDESQVPELKNFSAKKDSPRLAAGKSSQSLLSTGSSLPLTSRVSQARSEKRMDFLRRHASHRSCGGVRHMTLKSRRDVSFDELSPSYSEVSISEAQQDPIDLHVANYFRKQTEAQQDAKQAQQVDVPRPGILTILSCIALCTNTILGAGTLAVPFTMSLTGFVLYHVIVVLVLVANFASLRWLVDVAEVLPEDVPPSYEGIAHHFLGGTADAVISAAMVFGGFALTMAYMLFITTSLSSVLVAMKALSGLSKEAVHGCPLRSGTLLCVAADADEGHIALALDISPCRADIGVHHRLCRGVELFVSARFRHS